VQNAVSEHIAQPAFLRYVGSKQRQIAFLRAHLPDANHIEGSYIEPFVGGGAVFLAVCPKRAYLSDLNSELICLYRALAQDAYAVWKEYIAFPSGKAGYYGVRSLAPSNLSCTTAAARTLYLNRTCFGGNMRYNRRGQFNVGYGGPDRRLTITQEGLAHVGRRLATAILACSDFEVVIDGARAGDFIFADPPYTPGTREPVHHHYVFGTFKYADHERLMAALVRAERRGVRWAMTTSSHPDIMALMEKRSIVPLPHDPFKRLQEGFAGSGEALVRSE
jgi:DNA adenine methylase